MSRLHEFRCPIHGFIRLDDDERALVDSEPFQRLRQIHQLALTWLVYPGATHRRFEHSLGVAELAGRVYDVVTAPAHIHPDCASFVPKPGTDEHAYWRRALRLAALAHDLGHLPFSHAAEHDLLPPGYNHESLTIALIEAEPLASLWGRMSPAILPSDIVKLAVGPKTLPGIAFTAWQKVLAEIITGAAFGVDRMDYLLRDSWHAGVSYGVFDRARLVDTLRILPTEDGTPALGLEDGGLPSAEALMLARQFTYRQVYFHPIRRIYDIHLREFLAAWLPGGYFPTDPQAHLALTDAEVIVAMRAIARDAAHPAHGPARIIIDRQHYKRLYTGQDGGPPAVWLLAEANARFGAAAVRHDEYRQRSGAPDFPVLTGDGRVGSSLALSHTLRHIPALSGDDLFISRDRIDEARLWLAEELG